MEDSQSAELPQLPAEFVERLTRIVPESQRADVLRSFEVEKPTTFRINTLRGEVEPLRAELKQAGFELAPLTIAPEAFSVPAAQRAALIDTSHWREGRIYLQGLASMLAPLVLAPQPGEMVLDLAAAPGGKTIHLAGLMHNEGRISAVEPIRSRFYRLQENVKRCGAEIVRFYQTDGRTVGRKTPARFDRVLLDAPCSAEARFTRRDPESWSYWSVRKIKESARKQIGLLNAAAEAVRPGGLVLYGTCSLAPEENEQVVDRVLRRRDDLQLLPLSLPPSVEHLAGLTTWGGRRFAASLELTQRILPTARHDAFYLALLQRSEDAR